MDHSKPVPPPTGPTVCPFREEGPCAGPDTPPQQPRPTEPIEVDVDAHPEPECEVREQCEIPPGGPRPVPVAGRPVPTEAQRNAPKPPDYNDKVSKLLVMGFDRERSENALMAGDFDIKKALALLQGR